GLGEQARSFVAGILDHLPPPMGLTTPPANSYPRIPPHLWSGAFPCWGGDNREAAGRGPPPPPRSGAGRRERQTVDAAATPRRALGAVLAAGLDGLRRGLALSEPVQADPGNLSEQERRVLGADPLPASLGEALERLEGDKVLLGALGEELARAYLA